MATGQHRSPASTVTVGCVNFAGHWGNREDNLKDIADGVREAARQGIDVLVFPELALSGYEAPTEDGPTTELALQLDSGLLDKIFEDLATAH